MDITADDAIWPMSLKIGALVLRQMQQQTFYRLTTGSHCAVAFASAPVVVGYATLGRTALELTPLS